ncbi:MAG: hypothetical protein M9962_08090 [Oligoflexia bacterium]|nr:hypothetical protein [Oligoflexia bacterium]
MVVFLLLINLNAFANVNYFTTVFYDDGGTVFAGLKKEGENADSHIVAFPIEGGSKTVIALPKEISHRDIVGLIPDREKLFVLTTGKEEKFNGPMLHLYHQAKQEWKKIGQIQCPAFTSVKLSAKRMVFYCEVPGKMNKLGLPIVRSKILSYGKERLYRGGVWRFPEFMLRYKGVTLLLEGNAPHWIKLRLKSENGERVFQSEDLLELPVPQNTLLGPELTKAE